LAFVILFPTFPALAVLILGRGGAEPNAGGPAKGAPAPAAFANAMTRLCVVASSASGDANASSNAWACFAKSVPLYCSDTDRSSLIARRVGDWRRLVVTTVSGDRFECPTFFRLTFFAILFPQPFPRLQHFKLFHKLGQG
jgi:hypothetical protein